MIVALLSLLVSYIPCVLLFVYLRNLRKEDTDYRKNCTRLAVFDSRYVRFLACG